MKQPQKFLNPVADIVASLNKYGIDSILYGSYGVSIYLGNFKELNDVDLLIEQAYISEKWPDLVELMKTLGFRIEDKKEHEFTNRLGVQVSFAGKDILLRDGIVRSLNEIVKVRVCGLTLSTLSPTHFLNAYKFSQRDGYRLSVRKKKDNDVIDRLKLYINNQVKISIEQAKELYVKFFNEVLLTEDFYNNIAHSIKATLLYGSVAKGTNRVDSDIDILLIMPLEIEEKYTKGEYYYEYNGRTINIVIRSIEKLRTIAADQNDAFQKEVFRSSIIISSSDNEVSHLLDLISNIKSSHE